LRTAANAPIPSVSFTHSFSLICGINTQQQPRTNAAAYTQSSGQTEERPQEKRIGGGIRECFAKREESERESSSSTSHKSEKSISDFIVILAGQMILSEQMMPPAIKTQ